MSTFDGIHRVISACVAPPMQMSDGQHIAGVFISILPKEAGEPTVLQRPGLPLQPGVSGADVHQLPAEGHCETKLSQPT